MNLENIKIKKYKNYKELCAVIDEPIKTGNSKIAQLKEWRRFFNYKVNTNKSISILEVYSIIKSKNDKRIEYSQKQNK